MKKLTAGIIGIVLALTFVVSPVKASANTGNPAQNAQLIQLLMQMITILQAQLAVLQENNTNTTPRDVPAERDDDMIGLEGTENLSVDSITLSSSRIPWSREMATIPDQILIVRVKNNQYGSFNGSGEKFDYAVYLYEIVNGRQVQRIKAATGEATVPYANGYSEFRVNIEGGLGTASRQVYQAKVEIDTEYSIDESSERDNSFWSGTWVAERTDGTSESTEDQNLSISSITLSLPGGIGHTSSQGFPVPDQKVTVEVKNNQYGSFNGSGEKFEYDAYLYEVREDGSREKTTRKVTGEALVPYANGYTQFEFYIDGGLQFSENPDGEDDLERMFQIQVNIDINDDVDESNERDNRGWSDAWMVDYNKG